MRVQIYKEEGMRRGGAGSEGTDIQRGRDREGRSRKQRHRYTKRKGWGGEGQEVKVQIYTKRKG